MERAIRILLADDHAIVREGLRAVLGSEPDMEVVGEAATGKEVVERAAELKPDVILMDIQMPGINGIEATRRILNDSPHVGVVVLTMFEDDDSVFSAMRAGARGYILKGAPPLRDPESVARRGGRRSPLRAGDRPSSRGLPVRSQTILIGGGFTRAHRPRA